MVTYPLNVEFVRAVGLGYVVVVDMAGFSEG